MSTPEHSSQMVRFVSNYMDLDIPQMKRCNFCSMDFMRSVIYLFILFFIGNGNLY